MVKHWLCISLLSVFLKLIVSSEEYDYAEDINGYRDIQNDTDVYNNFEGRNEQYIHENRPLVNHYAGMNQGSSHLQELLNYHNPPIMFPSLKHKKKKGHISKKAKYLIPLLVAALAKVAHFLPVVKLILLALFGLVLFSKKAFLVSLGSLILVLYDHFYKRKQHISVGVGVVKDRGSTAPTIEHGVLPPEEHHHHSDHHGDPPEEAWWGRDETKHTKINPRESDDKWRRWWAPQTKYRSEMSAARRSDESDVIRRKFEELLSHITN